MQMLPLADQVLSSLHTQAHNAVLAEQLRRLAEGLFIHSLLQGHLQDEPLCKN